MLMYNSRKILITVPLFIIPFMLGIFLAGYNTTPTYVSATVLTEPKALPDFSLQDHAGKKFTRADLMSQWTFIFFGYTHCPDICPATLAVLNQVDKTLRETAATEIPATIFVSVDPDRDTTSLLADYMSYFNNKFLGVTGGREELKALTDRLGIAFGKENGLQADYEVFHTARIMLIDPHANLKALFSFPHVAADIIADYKNIISS